MTYSDGDILRALGQATYISNPNQTYMDKLFPVLLLLGVGAFGIGCGAIGLRTGTAVTFYRHTRAEHPVMFWYGTVFQFGLGIACIVMALVKAFE